MSRRFLRALWKTLVVSVAAGALALVLLLISVWVEHKSSLELPRPTGPFSVGRLTTSWVDPDRPDPFAAAPDQKRELVVWIWYPAKRSDQSRPAEYIPAAWERETEKNADLLLTLLDRDSAKVRGHSLEGATLAPDEPTYPVVIFRSGIGALALGYSTLVEDLASHGYIVVGADTPYSTTVVVMPDGRVIHRTAEGNPGHAPVSAEEQERLLNNLVGVWTADTRFLLDQVTRMNAADPSGRFTGRINVNSVGIVGHSFGGATAAQFCHDDDRCRAGIDMDGALHGSVVKAGINQPFLFLLSDHGNEWVSPDCQICMDIRSAATPNSADKLIVTLEKAHHFSFSDFALTQSRIVRSALVALGGPGGLDARTGLASTTHYVRAFFDVHLRGAPRETLYAAPLVSGARFEEK